MDRFLLDFAATIPANTHALRVLDGAGWHDQRSVTVPPNVILVELPPYSPELNPVERVWLYLRGRFLSLGMPDVPDGEVPREGVRLLRDYALARAASGAAVAWARRARRTGRGEGSSGLRFDAAELDRPDTNA